MNLDNIVPILVMVVYVALILLKRRRLKGAAPDEGGGAKKVSDTVPRVPGLFLKLGERLKAFFSELEQQFRIEAEKARRTDLEPGNFQDVIDLPDQESEGLWKDEPAMPMVARVKHELPGQRTGKKNEKTCRWGGDIRPCRQKIRSAVVWSEILGPPLALRGEKKPWEI